MIYAWALCVVGLLWTTYLLFLRPVRPFRAFPKVELRGVDHMVLQSVRDLSRWWKAAHVRDVVGGSRVRGESLTKLWRGGLVRWSGWADRVRLTKDGKAVLTAQVKPPVIIPRKPRV